MNAKDHYDHHLAAFYTWMIGNFQEGQMKAQSFFTRHSIMPVAGKNAVDLGAGHGLQSVSLAKLGFHVTAVDFNQHLLNTLYINKGDLPVAIVNDDIIHYLESMQQDAAVVVCMGDTLTHLEKIEHVELMFRLVYEKLENSGKLILSFRDLTRKVAGTQRFIPVKSDDTRILTCFLEYFPSHVMVHDILYEKKDDGWEMKASAYPKLRLDPTMAGDMLRKANFSITLSEVYDGVVYVIAEK